MTTCTMGTRTRTLCHDAARHHRLKVAGNGATGVVWRAAVCVHVGVCRTQRWPKPSAWSLGRGARPPEADVDDDQVRASAHGPGDVVDGRLLQVDLVREHAVVVRQPARLSGPRLALSMVRGREVLGDGSAMAYGSHKPCQSYRENMIYLEPRLGGGSGCKSLVAVARVRMVIRACRQVFATGQAWSAIRWWARDYEFADICSSSHAAGAMPVHSHPTRLCHRLNLATLCHSGDRHLMSWTSSSSNFRASTLTRSVCRVLLHEMQRAFASTPAPDDSTFTMLCATERTGAVSLSIKEPIWWPSAGQRHDMAGAKLLLRARGLHEYI